MYSSYTILVHLCERDGQLPFSAPSMNLLIELSKVRALYIVDFLVSCMLKVLFLLDDRISVILEYTYSYVCIVNAVVQSGCVHFKQN